MSKASDIAKEERGLAKKEEAEVDVYNMFGDDEGIDKVSELPEIKILHAAGIFQMPDGSTKPKIEGILLHDHKHNAWWEKSLEDSEEASAPDCFAIELVKGESLKPHPTCNMPQCHTICVDCDLNKWGSKGKGKACSNKISLFLLVPEYFVPLRMEVSAVSLKNCTDYIDSFKIRRKRYQTFVTIFSLKTETRGPNTFSVINFACGAEETDIHKLRGLAQVINDYKDLMLKVPEIRNELDE